MPDGIRLGGAFYEVTADTAPLVRAMAQAEAQSKKSAQAIAAATGLTEREATRHLQSLIRQHQALEKAGQQTDRAFKQIAGSTQQASGGFANLAKSALAFGAGAAGVALGSQAIGAALSEVKDRTLAADAALRQINATFGASAQAQKAFADSLAAASARRDATVEVGVARIGALQSALALSSQETQALSKASLNLAAVFGGDVAEAFRAVQAGARGEAESLEKYSIFVQDSTIRTSKAFQALNADQQKHWESLNELTKARVRAAAILEQAAKFEGEAEKRAQSMAGAFDRLDRATDSLAKTLGKSFVPALASGSDALTEAAKRLEATVKQFQAIGGAAAKAYADVKDAEAKALGVGKDREEAQKKHEQSIRNWLNELTELIRNIPSLPFLPGIGDVQREIDRRNGRGAAAPRPGAIAAEDVPAAQAQAQAAAAAQAGVLQDVTNAQRRRAEEDKERRRAELEAADKVNKATAESAINAIEAEKRAKERWYTEERQRIEQRRMHQLDDIEVRKKAALLAIEAERHASKLKFDQEIDQAEREKKLRIETAEQASKRAIAAIDAQKLVNEHERTAADRRIADANEQADRVLADAREQADRLLTETREKAGQSLTDAREQADRRISDARKQEDRRSEVAHDRAVRRIADAHTKAVRAIEREADADRRKSDSAIRGIERRADKEDEQHRKRMQALDDEQDAAEQAHQATLNALKAEENSRLSILDAQLQALDAQEKSADAAERLAGIQKRISDAQKAATAARGTGTPAEIAAARGDLTTALRVGNEASIAAARERLVQLAGKGDEEIRKADEALADAQADMAKEGVDNARNAERDKLKAAQDAIKAETDTRERALQEELDVIKAGIDARKRAEDDRNRQRKDELDKDKQAEQDRLKDKLDKLEKSKRAEDDAHQAAVRRDQDRTESAKQALTEQRSDQDRALKDSREAEDRQIKDSREAEDQRIKDSREAEDRQIKDSREAQDRRRADERQAEDEALEAQRKAIAQALEDEKFAAEEYYNGVNGVITKLKKASEATEYEYSRQVATVTAAFEAEHKAVERLYTNDEGTGALQLLEKQRYAEIAALDDRKREYEEQKDAFHEMIVAMLKDLDEFIAKQQQVPRIGGNEPAQRSPGAGKLTSSSKEQTRSRQSGQQVQGDITSWINDAMDITGVGNEWFQGLRQLAQLESSGDPHRLNDTGSGATGLMQMMPATFKGYKLAGYENILDPVSNVVAAIRYIQQEYLTGNKTGFPVDINWIVANHARRKGYDVGGMIREPVIGHGLRSGAPYTFAERGPEYLIGRRQTAMMGSAPQSKYAAMGAFMSSAHPGGAGSGQYTDNSSINVSGIGLDEVASEIERRQHRRQLLRGGRLR